ncbi:MAG TPA: alpha-glucosidase [Candidatus Lokiarchaeia archaeon]|nr:alpha-glucosidase [Candidatus Lokiarchaeia archaeon]
MHQDGSSNLPWWKKTTVYQIYPRSFMDSNGDGIGDIPGIISKLDYVKELGVETIWFSPFYKSPQKDHGYDISDYRDIAPEYGTLSDAEQLIEEMHARDMRIVLDMVMNHTSDEHPWFVESKSSRDNPKRDWYIWLDGKKPKGKKPPNNWQSVTTGTGWHYDPTTEQWYWAQFLPFQPDLNYRNPAVKEEMFDTVRFWLNKGVDGFRLDMINAIYEDAEFRDNPFAWKVFPSDADPRRLFRDMKYTVDHPDTFEFAKELRAVMDEFSDPERFLVGEVNGPIRITKQYQGDVVGGTKTNGLHLSFQFQALGLPFKAQAFKDFAARINDDFPDPYMPTLVFANHDRTRRISRLGNDARKAKLNATFQLTARGVPFIYYGEEIGMEQDYFPIKTAQDPVALKFHWVPQWIMKIARNTIHESLNRDECRTPMQWDASENAGFSPAGVKTWLPVTKGFDTINMSLEQEDPKSILACYKRLLALRNQSTALRAGAFQLLMGKGMPQDVLVYERTSEDQVLDIYLNFSSKSISFPIVQTSTEVAFSTYTGTEPVGSGKVTLAPFEGIVFEISK